MHIPKSLSLDMQGLRPPYAGSDKYGFVAVLKQIVDRNGRANKDVGANLDSHTDQFMMQTLQDILGETKTGNAVLQYTADFVMILKNSDIITPFCQDDSNRDSGRTGTDNGHTSARVNNARWRNKRIQIQIGNITLDFAEMYRLTLDP